MWEGYLQLGGGEIVNAARAAAYVKHQLPNFPLKNIWGGDDLHLALGDAEYESPLVDDAPWVDVSDLPTTRFYGVYPISVEGVGDSTRSANVSQSILDGGAIGQVRHGTREIRVVALLIAHDQLALESGLTWLRGAVNPEACGTHGATCGGADFCYFAAEPQVDPHAVNSEIPLLGSFSFGSLSPSTSPIIHRFIQQDGPASVEWVLPAVDGASVLWGALALDSSTVLEQSGPVVLQRTNFARNSSFTVDTSWWEAPTGTLSRVATGGFDDGAFGRVAEASPPTVRTNWVADPSFSGDPALANWRTNALSFESVADGTAPTGTRVGLATPDGTGADMWVEVSTLGPIPRGEATASIYVAARTADVTVTVTDNTGALVDTEVLTGFGSAWNRKSFTTPNLGENYIIRFTSAGDEELRVDAILIESGATLGGFIVGDMAPVGAKSYYFLDGTPYSISREQDGARGAVELRSGETNAIAGPNTLTPYLRSADGADVSLQLRSVNDDSVLASLSIALTPEWQRYSLSSGFGRNVRIVIVGEGTFDIDGVLDESGTFVRDYFDGSHAPATDYAISWLGPINASASRMRWTGAAATMRPDSDWRPFITAETGNIEPVQLEVTQFTSVDVDDCLDIYQRRYHDVVCIDGPKITGRFSLEFGAMYQVEMLFAAATPWAFANSHDIDLGTPLTAGFTDAAPVTIPVDPLFDPDCPPIALAPRPPIIDLDCVASPTVWTRYYSAIPRDQVSSWSSTVPTIKLITLADEVRQVRVRFHPNPFNYDVDVVDPLEFCSEFIISYLPANTVLTVDGMLKRAIAEVAGGAAQPADHLLYGTGGVPISWPELSCGIGYVMTVDIPPTDADNLTVELAMTRRE
jgi:hypothetical protein